MKTIITYFIFLITIFLTNINNLYAVDVTGEATTYKNTIHALQLCETGSTLANCLNPITIGSSTSGKTMDLSVRGSANSFGNAGLITPGITYTHGQVIMSRTFTISGSIATGSATCFTGGAAGTLSQPGMSDNTAEDLSEAAEQTLVAGNGTGNGDDINSTSAVSGGTDAVAGTLSAGHNFMKSRWELISPLTVRAGELPSMKISFDLSNALRFSSETATCANDNPAFLPGKPSISNTFE